PGREGVAHVRERTLAGYAGAAGGAGIYSGGVATLTNSTVSGNSAIDGGGIYQDCCDQITVTASIVANNPLGGNCYESHPAWPIVDNDNNFADINTCGLGFMAIIPGTHFDTVLADNGGPTMTHALLAGSPAIDAAPSCGSTFDQRGAPRFDGACDSGAFEYGGCSRL
ncbi:MAG: hypothetical protein GY778_18420, partial [bacterium]|nr:hypothetical protein [bacterium]